MIRVQVSTAQQCLMRIACASFGCGCSIPLDNSTRTVGIWIFVCNGSHVLPPLVQSQWCSVSFRKLANLANANRRCRRRRSCGSHKSCKHDDCLLCLWQPLQYAWIMMLRKFAWSIWFWLVCDPLAWLPLQPSIHPSPSIGVNIVDWLDELCNEYLQLSITENTAKSKLIAREMHARPCRPGDRIAHAWLGVVPAGPTACLVHPSLEHILFSPSGRYDIRSTLQCWIMFVCDHFATRLPCKFLRESGTGFCVCPLQAYWNDVGTYSSCTRITTENKCSRESITQQHGWPVIDRQRETGAGDGGTVTRTIQPGQVSNTLIQVAFSTRLLSADSLFPSAVLRGNEPSATIGGQRLQAVAAAATSAGQNRDLQFLFEYRAVNNSSVLPLTVPFLCV